MTKPRVILFGSIGIARKCLTEIILKEILISWEHVVYLLKIRGGRMKSQFTIIV